MIYLISYDLKKKPDRDYSGLFDVLKSFSSWWHYLESTWLISTKDDANEIYNKLRPHVNDNDSLLIIKVNKDRQGWLPKKAWDWIKTNVD